MDVRLSPEQEALRDAAAGMAARLGPRSVRDLDDRERSARLDASVAASGWRDLRAAGEGRSPLASGVEAALVAEQLAARLADTAFIGPTLAADLRRRAGCPPAPMAETVALRADLGGLATADDLAGGAAVAVDASNSTAALLVVAGQGGTILAAAATGAPLRGADLTRVTAAVEPALEELGGAVLSEHDLDGWAALGLALSCADLVGVMRGALRLGCEYVSARRQFGVPVGSFQAVQHLLADAHVAAEGSASVALHAAWAVDAAGGTDALAAASAAKAYCARSALDVCETVIQVHGGIGNTWDCLAHVFLRRALLAADLLGGVGASLQRVLAHRGIDGGGGRGLR